MGYRTEVELCRPRSHLLIRFGVILRSANLGRLTAAPRAHSCHQFVNGKLLNIVVGETSYLEGIVVIRHEFIERAPDARRAYGVDACLIVESRTFRTRVCGSLSCTLISELERSEVAA